MLDTLLLLLANGDPAPADGAPPGGGLGGMLVPVVIMVALFYFLLILPAQRRERKHRETVLNALKKGDKVVTNAGIIGVVSFVKDEEVTLKLEEGKMRVLRSTVAKILGDEEQAKEPVQEAGKKTP